MAQRGRGNRNLRERYRQNQRAVKIECDNYRGCTCETTDECPKEAAVKTTAELNDEFRATLNGRIERSVLFDILPDEVKRTALFRISAFNSSAPEFEGRPDRDFLRFAVGGEEVVVFMKQPPHEWLNNPTLLPVVVEPRMTIMLGSEHPRPIASPQRATSH